MRRQIERLAGAAGVLIVGLFLVFLVNQTAQVVELANALSPMFGRIVLVALLLLYAGVVATLGATFAGMPPALRPPADDQSPEFAAHLKRLGSRLAGNRHLAGVRLTLDQRAGVEAALALLKVKADALVKNTAATVFVTTAISQSGRLDALMVLVAQSRMVWQIAHIYHQRPSLRELIRLYANVAGTTLLISEIEDLDISEQVEPVITAALGGSLAGAVPGVSLVAGIITDAILEGTANAYLTLRVGIVCRQYCAPLVAVQRKTARRFASVEAAGLLGSIVMQSAGSVSKAIGEAAKKAGASAWGSMAGGVAQTFRRRRRPGGTTECK